MKLSRAPALWLSTIILCASTTRPAASQQFDADRAAALGIRKVEGRFVTLYTDLEADPEVDQLPQVFDAAVPIWRQYFETPVERTRGWRINAFLMKSDAAFRTCGALGPTVPRFPNGFSIGRTLWMYEQPTAYYRRHLLLHEGTHAFMNTLLEGAGPPWYMEGVAELLATHQWIDGKLLAPFFPQRREQTPHWGRIKIVQDTLAAGRGMRLSGIMNYSPRAHLENEPYGWCWAAAAFLNQHPAYRQAFAELRGQLSHQPAEFNAHLPRKLGPEQWNRLLLEWQWYAMNLDYGYDVPREAIVFRRTAPLAAPVQVVVAADRGWQSSGIRLEAGQGCRISAEGKFQVAKTSKPWLSEAGGVTIQYHDRRPLGMLLAAVHDDSLPPKGLTKLCRPQAIGASGTLTAARAGVLFLRINDHPARRGDNAGTLNVRIEPPSR